MPHDIDHNTAAQRRTSKLLAAMAIFICLGIVAYIILTLLVNRQTPANPDTHYTGTNGVSVYYDSSIWKVCQMTEDATLGTVLELATADSADGAEDYQAVLLQRGFSFPGAVYCCSVAPPTPTRTSSTILRRT